MIHAIAHGKTPELEQGAQPTALEPRPEARRGSWPIPNAVPNFNIRIRNAMHMAMQVFAVQATLAGTRTITAPPPLAGDVPIPSTDVGLQPTATSGSWSHANGETGSRTVSALYPRPGSAAAIADAAMARPIAADVVRTDQPQAIKVFASAPDKAAAEPLELLMRQGLSAGQARLIAKQYARAGITLNEKTVFGEFQDQNRIRAPLRIKRGMCNNVFEVKYLIDGGRREFHGVFKEERRSGFFSRGGAADAAALIGLGPEPFRYAARSVASYLMSRMLGWDVIPRTEFAIDSGRLGTVTQFVEGVFPIRAQYIARLFPGHPVADFFMRMRDDLDNNPEQLGKVLQANGLRNMYFSKGAVFIEFGIRRPGIDYENPDLLMKTMYVQNLDQLSGQVERHGENWLFTSSPEVQEAFADSHADASGSFNGAMGIDNDVAFGPDEVKIDDLFHALGSAVTKSPIIDTKMYADVMARTEQELEDRFDGLLERPEIEARKFSLNEMQEHYRHLRKMQDEDPSTPYIIEPTEWKRVVNDPRLNPRNCYLARERAQPNDELLALLRNHILVRNVL
jgi:hypothetical protein